MMQPVNNNQQTPLQKLISEKEEVRRKCQLKGEKLNDDFAYIQQNSGSLLLSGLSSLLFPKTKGQSDSASKSTAESSLNQTVSLELSDYLSMAKGMMPVLWDIARPILITWGIARARSIFTKILHRK